jgi:3-deoxy-D-manno-octulosonate 8-phosphate phosphatase (KDO 8-P phosphatase)
MIAKLLPKKAPKHFILDVDGVMTDGKFYYTKEGKVMKIFGSDDHDALCLLKPYMDISFVTGDHRGFDISKKRIGEDMKMPIELVSTTERIRWIKEKFDPQEVVYMGDGIFDHYVMREVGYAIAPANADSNAKAVAHFVTERLGGDRAVAEASLHLLETFFEEYKPEEPLPDTKYSGVWGV